MPDEERKYTKVPYTISLEMDQALKTVHDQTGIPIARLVRNGIRMVLAQYGIEVSDDIKPGGRRAKQANETGS